MSEPKRSTLNRLCQWCSRLRVWKAGSRGNGLMVCTWCDSRERGPLHRLYVPREWVPPRKRVGLLVCDCGHLWDRHDMEEYRGDGTETCRVEGCDQIGCPGRKRRMQP